MSNRSTATYRTNLAINEELPPTGSAHSTLRVRYANTAIWLAADDFETEDDVDGFVRFLHQRSSSNIVSAILQPFR